MARDHARIRLDIWADDDFRDLTAIGQWLYFNLLTSPDLSFCGITDWRPARIAAVTRDLSAFDVEIFAAELEAKELVVIDRSSEEALVRSFVKHDGLMKQPNIVKALVKDHAAVASSILRAVIVGQLDRLHDNDPGLNGWRVEGIQHLLRRASLTPAEAFEKLPPNPSVNPSSDPSGRTSVTHFLPTSLPPSSLPRSPRLPSEPQEEPA